MEGDTPWNVFSLVTKKLRAASQNASLIVMHDPDRVLPILIHSVEGWLDIDLRPLTVVGTGALERARCLGLKQDASESDTDFHQLISVMDGDVPDLLTCYCEQEWVDGVIQPTDRMFPALATHAIYRNHLPMHLLQASDGASVLP